MINRAGGVPGPLVMADLIIIERYVFSPVYTLGRLFVRGNVRQTVTDPAQFGFTMEQEVRPEKIKGQTAIWEGTYPLGTRESPSLSKSFLWSEKYRILIQATDLLNYPWVKDFTPHRMIWIRNVPEFEFIYLHWGNIADNSAGCPIVGSKEGYVGKNRAVLNSRELYIRFYEKVYPVIKGGELSGNFETITIRKALGVELS